MNAAGLLALALTMLALPAPAQDADAEPAADPVALSYRPAEGRDAQYMARLEGQVVQQGATIALKAAFVFAVRIVEVDEDAGAVVQRIVFGPGRVRLGDHRLGWALRGRAYTVVRERSGRIVEVRTRAPAPAANQGDFAAVFHDMIFSVIFPADPVRLGDEWDHEIDEEPVIFEPDPAELEDRSVHGGYTGRLAELPEVTGARMAVIEGASEMVVVSKAAEVRARWTATVTVDATDGWPVRAQGTVGSLEIRPRAGLPLRFEDLDVEIDPYVPEEGAPTDRLPVEAEE